MEKLKFRAFVKSLNKVLDVVEIRFLANEVGVGKHHDWNYHYYDMEDCVLMRSINEVDKNGIQIFEGYILKGSWDKKFQIVYCEIEKCFKAKDLDTEILKQFDYYGKMNECEIIGNIYENKDL